MTTLLGPGRRDTKSSSGASIRPIPCAIASWYPAAIRALTEDREKSPAFDNLAERLDDTTLKWLIFR